MNANLPPPLPPSATPPRPAEGEDVPLAAGWKWLIVFLAALIGSAIAMIVEGEQPSDPAGLAVVWLAGAVPPFGVAMLVAIFIRGLGGAIAGVLVVAAVLTLSTSSALQTQRERKERSQSELGATSAPPTAQEIAGRFEQQQREFRSGV